MNRKNMSEKKKEKQGVKNRNERRWNIDEGRGETRKGQRREEKKEWREEKE